MVRRHGAVHARPSAVDLVGPVRTCVGCRAKASAAGLLRVVVVEGVIVPDPQRRRPGRGAWLHPDPECLRAAERRRAFPRALRVEGPLDTAAVHAHLAGDPPSVPLVGSRSTRHEPAVKLKP